MQAIVLFAADPTVAEKGFSGASFGIVFPSWIIEANAVELCPFETLMSNRLEPLQEIDRGIAHSRILESIGPRTCQSRSPVIM